MPASAMEIIDIAVKSVVEGVYDQEIVNFVNKNLPLGMDFSDIYHSQRARTIVGGFEGKHVLEMGGALNHNYVTKYLSPSTWSAVEYNDYQDNQFITDLTTSSEQTTDYFYDDSGWELYFRKWKALRGKQFDIIYSIAAFEHIDGLPDCLDACYDMLKPSGLLYTYFTPIWSAKNGSHGFLPSQLENSEGHAHLLFDYSSLTVELQSSCNYTKSQASAISYSVYKSKQINRLSFEDYCLIFDCSAFSEKRIHAIEKADFYSLYDESKISTIAQNYPNMKISCSGFECIMRK